MNESDTQLADVWKMPAEVAEVFAEKMQGAKETLNERILKAQEPSGQSCSGTRYANAATILLSTSGRASRLCSISITRC